MRFRNNFVQHTLYEVIRNIGSIETNPNEKENYVNAEINVIEQMGNEEYVYFTLGDRQFTARLDSKKVKNTKYGVKYQFWFDMEKCHIFDFETEENISL